MQKYKKYKWKTIGKIIKKVKNCLNKLKLINIKY